MSQEKTEQPTLELQQVPDLDACNVHGRYRKNEPVPIKSFI